MKNLGDQLIEAGFADRTKAELNNELDRCKDLLKQIIAICSIGLNERDLENEIDPKSQVSIFVNDFKQLSEMAKKQNKGLGPQAESAKKLRETLEKYFIGINGPKLKEDYIDIKDPTIEEEEEKKLGEKRIKEILGE